ncbi:MAG TPA: ThiF family adenylyltransferase [Blastocatellia bacterium]|nr:ThiF family adenylyltransferase [Blastocatellia bacterium]
MASIVGVGIGGAVGLYEDLVRCNLGTLTAVDFDSVDESNLTTQGFEKSDVGIPKTYALGKRIRGINPALNYKPITGDFLKLSESEIEELVRPADLLMFMTDDFHAQARGNLVALKFQIPALFAIVYERARCAEITFIIPGVTPACHRCAVSPRYKEYKDGYKNIVKQQSSTIFQTHYLNSCLGLLALAILHRNTKGLEFSNWFGDSWRKNLIQLRMHPSYGTNERSIFRRNFESSPNVFTFDAVWQNIEPEAPPKYEACPDCGGTGDLTAISPIFDTMPKL